MSRTKRVALTHGVSVDELKELSVVCDDICSTDTIENPTTCISVASEIARVAED